MLRVSGIAMLLVAALLLRCGLWEIMRGRRLPGILAWTYLPRHRARAARTWTPRRWRMNGLVLIVIAAIIGWWARGLMGS